MSVANDLLTVRDLLRYAVSRFNGAGLTYGHGTSTALDEAAFLILVRTKRVAAFIGQTDDINHRNMCPAIDKYVVVGNARPCTIDKIPTIAEAIGQAPYFF